MSLKRTQDVGFLNRRSYLTLTGATVAGMIGGTGTGSATDDGYETVTVPEGKREVVYVNDDETLENVLFDVTACGAGVTIVAYGSGWTIRNIGVRGQVDMDDNTVIGGAVTDGGSARIENVWIGDGAVYEEEGGIGIWLDPEHDGHLTIDRVNVQEMGNNAFYCSSPGGNGDGTVTFRNCYAANCGIAHYRLARGTVDNCVAAVTDDRQHRQGRGVWAWPSGPVFVKDSQFAMNGNHYSFVPGAEDEGSTMVVVGTQWDDEFRGGWTDHYGGTVHFVGTGNDPQNTVPAGCPTSVMDAVED
ncbi:hypothetical protein [Natronorubrum texcoconense]|uniref:Right handed beta helix region n=1 Tax=Natronorubrum texcoconense TaxID=1095776 RepID=A0A1G9E658_9EURY|nr:hypothetical protein [Natronorubrum texcoconense]SDK71583.1 hypothetical protein SAMN04515672_3773 [Natronorubrum texcoconense]